MANSTPAPYLGTQAEIGAHKNGGCPEILSPEGVWTARVEAADLNGELATRTIDLTFGGTEANGNYQTVFALDGVTIATVITVRAGGNPATNEDLAEQHALDIEAETDLDDYRADVNAQGETASVEFLPGLAITATPTAPVGATLTASYQMGLNLNDLQPNEAFPADALRGESPMIRVVEAFAAGSTATLEDEGVASSTVLSAVPVDVVGYFGDTNSDVGQDAKTEADWEPYLTVSTPTALPTTGEIKVQVVCSPLPE